LIHVAFAFTGRPQISGDAQVISTDLATLCWRGKKKLSIRNSTANYNGDVFLLQARK
jgi:hypothetical protein